MGSSPALSFRGGGGAPGGGRHCDSAGHGYVARTTSFLHTSNTLASATSEAFFQCSLVPWSLSSYHKCPCSIIPFCTSYGQQRKLVYGFQWPLVKTKSRSKWPLGRVVSSYVVCNIYNSEKP